MKKRLSNILGIGNVSDSPLDLDAYSYCSSEAELKPKLIAWPKTLEQVRKLILFANQTHTSLLLRGSGSGSVDATIGENTLVVSSEKMKKITQFDVENKIIEVESGMRISDLNDKLAEFKLCFLLTPQNPVQTIGSMVALNMATKETQALGRMADWVEEVEFVDGTGKYYNTKKKELVFGREGLTGFITKVKLKLADKPSLSFDIFSFTQLLDLLKQVRVLKKDLEVYFIEFFDKKISKELGFDDSYLLIVAYSVLKGKNRTIQDAKKISNKLDLVYPSLRLQKYFFTLDPFVSLEKAYDLIEWCEKNNVRLHGHIGIGLFYAYFQKEDKDLMNTFKSFIRRINGDFGEVFGHGSVNKSFVNPVKKKELIKLKDEYDYNNILNPSKFIDYR
ncbi:MAG: FAD-binding oxidoreductase [Nanoarchaeota archaeon]|nr:FAD-binding oxidoreductase [Nanoarchaeota archaeon]MBU1321136.1 FAD-binding oxidoreductase [Nanoarchaeota archaeon]MBU1597967.1 FAD-binding oxidoreductase [Nanoarchaeota archaeon]MBU2441812.1 FAD-binding oxidoreductase [Nanoarchaeota archaeon]